MEVKCTCFFCKKDEPHPDKRHPNFHSMGSIPLKANSLNPKDWLPFEACLTCGHRRKSKR